MKAIIKKAINHGGYDLAAITEKIDTLWVEGKMSEAERTELIESARAGAKPADSMAPQADRLAALELAVKELTARVAALEGGEAEGGEVEGMAEWVQPTGAHDAYNVGDRVTFKGTTYESTMDGNVWSPSVNPNGWQDIETA